jgi:hypothetical protein
MSNGTFEERGDSMMELAAVLTVESSEGPSGAAGLVHDASFAIGDGRLDIDGGTIIMFAIKFASESSRTGLDSRCAPPVCAMTKENIDPCSALRNRLTGSATRIEGRLDALNDGSTTTLIFAGAESSASSFCTNGSVWTS